MLSKEFIGHVRQFIASRAMLWLTVAVTLCAVVLYAVCQVHFKDSKETMNPCHQVVVTFNDDAPIAGINHLLVQLNAEIVAGPDAQGAFFVWVKGQPAAGVIEQLNQDTDSVLMATLSPQCRGQ